MEKLPRVFSKLLTKFSSAPNDEGQNFFDRSFYLNSNPDVRDAGVDAYRHFIDFGAAEGRNPNPLFSEKYVRNYNSQQPRKTETAQQAYINSDLWTKPRLIFVSHEATRTGAPAIILRLLEMFSESGMFECFTFMERGGERLAEFEALSHTYVMSHPPHTQSFSNQQAFEEISALVDTSGIFKQNAPVCALVNSAVSNRIGSHLGRLNIPMISLIHEIAAYFPPNVFEDFCKRSEKVIFPSQFVKRAANIHCDIDETKIVVRGQGLLSEGFGTLSQPHSRKMLCDELNIEDDAFIVLNVGTLNERKGADLFVEAAKLMRDRSPKSRPVYFAWFGEALDDFTYCQEFIERHDLSDFVKLMPSTSEIERVFLGSDLFLLTARGDPFPCVIHEAMACGLPVIAFQDGGGAPELIGDDCGTSVGMANLVKVCDAIDGYLEDDELYRKHSQNAVQKIAQHWSYEAYLKDIYLLMQECLPIPQSGWPEVSLKKQPSHLVIMHGLLKDLEILEWLKQNSNEADFEIVLIESLNNSDIDHVTEQIKQLGYRYAIHQPADNSFAAHAEIVDRVTSQPRPEAVTFINTAHFLTASKIALLAYPKTIVDADNTLSLNELYNQIPHVNSIVLSNPTMIEDLINLNPLAKSKLRFESFTKHQAI